MKTRLVLLFLLTFTMSHSQISNVEKFLDDGGRSEVKDIIKTDINELLTGNLPLIWEHLFFKHLSLQGGIGVLSNKMFTPVITPLISQDRMYKGLNGGYSLFLQPTFYMDGFESFHFGTSFKYRRYTSQTSSHEYSFTVGKQWIIGRRLCVDIEGGLGLNFEKSLDGNSYIYCSDVQSPSTVPDTDDGSYLRGVFPLTLKIGYCF